MTSRQLVLVVLLGLVLAAIAAPSPALGASFCETADFLCAPEGQYPKQTKLEAAGTESATITADLEGIPEVIVSCSETSLQGEVISGEIPPQRSSSRPAEILGFQLGACQESAANASCTATAAGLPFAVELGWDAANDGAAAFRSGGSGTPGFHLLCEDAEAEVLLDCTFSFQSPQLERNPDGTLTAGLQLVGGDPAQLIAEDEQLAASGKICPGGSLAYSAAYTIESPQPLYVGASDPHDSARIGTADPGNGTPYNKNFKNDGVDDYRIDADIALLDHGAFVDMRIGKMTIHHRVDCVFPDPFHELFQDLERPTEGPYVTPDFESDPDWLADPFLNDPEESGPYGCLDNSGEPYPDQTSNGTVHTSTGMTRGAQLDGGGVGTGGLAPGAKAWSVRVFASDELGSEGSGLIGMYPNPVSFPEHQDYDPDAPKWLPGLGISHAIAGLDWVASTRTDVDPENDIEVAGIWWGCTIEGHPVGEQIAPGAGCDSAELQALREAADRAIDAGVVLVAGAGNFSVDIGFAVPQNVPDVLTVSQVHDSDGLPGGEDVGCGASPDDELWSDSELESGEKGSGSDFGPAVSIASPGCGATSGGTGRVVGAAAALASQCPPANRAGVQFIIDTLMAEGETGEIGEGGWKDTSGDGWKEPLLDLSDEDVFDPVMIDTETGEREQADPGSCEWRSHQAGSDVGSDGRADLVAIDGAGKRAAVFAGEVSGYDVADPTTSLGGQLDSALLDGEGRYAIDSADVDGDRNADLITAVNGDGIYVHPGSDSGAFGPGAKSKEGITLSYDGAHGQREPIAAADVDGDERADLVSFDSASGDITTALGRSDGTLGADITTDLSLDSALLDGQGRYFLDAIDVTGEDLNDSVPPIDYNLRSSRADLVTIGTDGFVYVHPGKADGTFAPAITAAQVNPIMDDGKGEEPIGLGDVDRDRRADLLTLSGQTLKLYLAKDDGTFSEPIEPFAGSIDSSLMDGIGAELVGLLDYSRDGLADLVSVAEDGTLSTYTAQRDKTFAQPLAHGGTSLSTRESPGGNEFVAEKPLIKRAGCSPEGCRWPPEPTPIAAYSFDQGEGQVLPDSAGDHDGTIQGAAWTSSGKYGAALDFDGTNDLVSIADAAQLDLTGSFTLEAWVRPDVLTGARPVLAKLEDLGSGPSGYVLSTTISGDKPGGRMAKTGTHAVAAGPTALPSAAWSHLTVSSDGATLRFYVNGELAASASATVTPPSTAIDLEIGHNPLWGGYFDGRIDEVRIYDVPLSQAQIQADRDNGL